MVIDINLKDPEWNLLTKFADDLIICVCVTITGDSAADEVKNVKEWVNIEPHDP